MELAKLIQKTAHNFNWYQAMLNEHGEIGRTFSDLLELPLITDEILNLHYHHVSHAALGNSFSYLTSGTKSGKRKRILYSENDQKIYLQQRTAIIRNFCGTGFNRACADLGTGHAAATANEIFEGMGCEVASIDFSRPLEEHIAVLNRFQPEIFFTMPMILDRLLASDALDFEPKKIILLGDVATAAWQQKVALHFNLASSDILDLFGSIEIGSIAFFNHELGCYQFDPYILPETIHPAEICPDADYNGSGRILVLTSFAREYFPAVRYVTNDLLDGFALREYQGKNIYTYDRCLGRFSNEYKHGEKINLYDINDAMAKYLPQHQYDLEDAGGTLTIRIASPKIEPHIISTIKTDILSRNPDVKQMIASGLVGDIAMVCVASDRIVSSASKRRY